MFTLLESAAFERVESKGSMLIGRLAKSPPWMGKEISTRSIALYADSVNDYLDWLMETRKVVTPLMKSLADSEYMYFNTYKTFDIAWNIFRHEPHTLNTFEENTVPMRYVDAVGNDVNYDVTGSYLDMGRYLEGEPECWGYNTMGNPNGLFATIIINPSATAATDAAVLNHRANRLLRLIDWLERQGIRTEIVLIDLTQCGYIEISVKKFEHDINLDTLAVVSHGDFLRRMIFRGLEFSQTLDSGYGRVRLFRRGECTVPQLTYRGLMIVSEAHPRIEDADKAFDVAEKKLEESLEEGEKYTHIFV